MRSWPAMAATPPPQLPTIGPPAGGRPSADYDTIWTVTLIDHEDGARMNELKFDDTTIMI